MKLALALVATLAACAGSRPESREPIVVTPSAVPFVPLQVGAEPDAGPRRSARLRSYEEALAAPAPDVPAGTPELTDQQLAGPMRSNAFLEGCGVPGSSKLTLRIVVQGGEAVGLTVRIWPEDDSARHCVEEYVRTLAWPANPHRDSFTTTY